MSATRMSIARRLRRRVCHSTLFRGELAPRSTFPPVIGWPAWPICCSTIQDPPPPN